MTDAQRKAKLKHFHQLCEQQAAIIEGYSKQITELKEENQRLRQQLTEAQHIINLHKNTHHARIDESECEAFNLQ